MDLEEGTYNDVAKNGENETFLGDSIQIANGDHQKEGNIRHKINEGDLQHPEEQLYIGSCMSVNQLDVIEYDRDRLAKAPDGGYGWVIVAASFFIYAVAGGILFTLGVFFTIFSNSFKRSKTETALVGSLFAAFMFMCAPIASILSNRYTHRVTTILGGSIMAVGFLISAFATNLYILYASFGGIAGAGMSFFFSPCLTVVSMYFDRRRVLAVGISVTGSGIGTFAFPIAIGHIMDFYGWRGCLIFLSGLSLNGMIFGSLLRPLYTLKKTQIIDIGLLKECTFILYFVANLCLATSVMMLWQIMPDQAIEKGVKVGANNLVSYAGILASVGRTTFAFLANSKKCNRVLAFGMFTLCNAIPIVTLLLFAQTYEAMLIAACIFGSLYGLQTAAIPVVIGQLFTIDRMTSAYGLILVSDGLGSLIGPPIAGLIFDRTGSYIGAGLLSGILSICSGTILLYITLFHSGFSVCCFWMRGPKTVQQM